MAKKIYCPHCGKWLFTTDENTKGTIYIWCRRCQAERKIIIKEPLSR